MERFQSLLTLICTIALIFISLMLINSATRHNYNDPVACVRFGSYAYPIKIGFGMLAANGDIDNVTTVSQHGRTVNADTGHATDVWQGSVDDIIFQAPTQARIHNITSTSLFDDLLGTGVQKLRIYGLPDWDTAETSEVVDMDGTNVVPTSGAYVFINHMEAIQFGGTSNVGIISATAVIDGTVSAYIAVGQGRTEQAIYGFPSVQDLLVYSVRANSNKAGGGNDQIDVTLWCNNTPDNPLAAFLNLYTFGIMSAGNSSMVTNYGIPEKFSGPCIIKLQALTSANNSDISGGFEGLLITQ